MDNPSWSTQQLTQLLLSVSRAATSAEVMRHVVEQAAEAFEAEVAGVVVRDDVPASIGFGRSERHRSLVDVRSGDVLDVPGAGNCVVLSGAVPDRPDTRLVVARSLAEWTPEERGLLRAMAQVLALSLQSLDVLAELHERQALLERVARIQRSISSRKPLHEVLDAIVAGAAELLREDIVALRLLDPQDPEYLLLAASIGVPEDLVEEARRTPVAAGVGGRAVREQRLVVAHGYAGSAAPIHGFVRDGISAAMAAPVRQGEHVVGSLTIATRRANRTYSPSEQEALAAFAEHAGLALNDAHTVEALHQAVEEATHQALHDPLTGLPNRALFLDRLSHTLARVRRRTAEPFAVLFVDVDDFKMVNDGLGHLVGDRLLAEAGDRICSAVRAPDTVARLGGDEFAVLVEDVDLAAATATAQRVLDRLAAPFALPGGHVVHVGASIGVVTVESPDRTPEELLRDADIAMYHAKQAGKARVVVFEPGMRLRLQARSELEHDLRRGLEADEFVVHYQPVVDLLRRRVVGLEALLRWEHPRRGLVSPAEFVPVAEETGLIVALGTRALGDACVTLAGWRECADLDEVSVSVNVSPRQLAEADLVDTVDGALRHSGLAPHRLVLEITESLLVQDVAGSALRLAALKRLGVRLAVDDFGTGYSSLSYLSQLPVDTLKIDRAFVRGVTQQGPQGKLAGAVVALAGSLGLSTVAEGVETPQEADCLVALGATVVQGFDYAPAVPADAVSATVAEVNARLRDAAPFIPRARRGDAALTR